MLKLYELVDQYAMLLDVAGSEDSTPEAFGQALKDLQGEIKDKAENVAKVVKSLEANAKAIVEEAKRLQERAHHFVNRSDSLRSYLLNELSTAGITKVEGLLATVSTRLAPMSCEIEDMEQVPYLFRRYIPESWQPDKKALIEAHKEGQTWPGIRFIEDKKYLVIR